MTTTSETKLSLKLLIDTKARKVVFAEAEKDCVDFLFHILSLPVGSVVRLLKEKGMNGCLPNLYGSIENLNDTYIQSKEGKNILLKPNSPVGISSIPLLLLSDDVPTQKTLYKRSYSCSSSYATDDPNAICPNCGTHMSAYLKYVAPPIVKGAAAAKGGLVKEAVTFMVMDDLVVKPTSAISSITSFDKLNVKDAGVLQEKVVNIGVEEALKLLKASFESKTVLTSVFLSHVKAEK